MVPLPIARRANYPMRCLSNGFRRNDAVFGVSDGPKQVSRTRCGKYNNLYTKDRAECKYSAAGSSDLLPYLNFDTKWFRTTWLKIRFSQQLPLKK